jgi:hypothetical protein
MRMLKIAVPGTGSEPVKYAALLFAGLLAKLLLSLKVSGQIGKLGR